MGRQEQGTGERRLTLPCCRGRTGVQNAGRSRNSRLRFVFPINVALLVFGAAHIAAQDARPSRYPANPSLVIADSGEARISDRRVSMQYPLPERQAGIEASLTAVFVLDTTGRVEMSTVTLVGPGPPAFRAEICRWLSRIQVEPVVRDGVRYRALVVNPFSFMLTGGALAQQPRETGEALRKAIIVDGIPHAALLLDPFPHC